MIPVPSNPNIVSPLLYSPIWWTAVKMPQEQTVLKRQMDATDRQIVQLVYELGGLAEAEIKSVEVTNA